MEFEGEGNELPDLYANMQTQQESGIEWYENAYGEDALIQHALENNNVDLDSLIEREASWYSESPNNYTNLWGENYWGSEEDYHLFSYDY
jgi:hypothetical protein